MLKRSLRIKVIAAMFSAAFLFGVSPADAYTYSGGTVTVDQVAEDENDLVVTGGANVSSNTTLIPQKNKVTTTTNYKINTQKIGTLYTQLREPGKPQAGTLYGMMAEIVNLPKNIDNEIANEIIDTYKIIAQKANQRENGYFSRGNIGIPTDTKEFDAINKKYGFNLNFYCAETNPEYFKKYVIDTDVTYGYFYYNLIYTNGEWSFDTSKIDTDLKCPVPNNSSSLNKWFNVNENGSETINLKTSKH